jgi:phosphatidylserine/phosphatidylglycerophosphate/cardiolipin synthase-like enzyme
VSRSAPPRPTPWLVWTLVLIGLVVVVGVGVWIFGLRRPPTVAAPPSSPSPLVVASAQPAAAAAGGAAWEVAFTVPVLPPDNDPTAHRGSLDARLVQLMDRATSTLDVADYDFDLANVADAMTRAAKRGARVRMVTDSDTLDNTRDAAVQAAFKALKDAGIPIVPDGRPPIMHNKFTVVDGEWVEMGSWNYTDGDTYHLNNNLAIWHSRELADNYTAEFEKMFVQKKFGPNKPKGVPHPTLEVAGMRIENYFAAEDRVASHIIDKLGQAQKKIHFLAFSFTHDGIGAAMLARKQAGVELQGVFETTGSNTPFSEYTRLKQAGAEVYQDGNPYVMHHKIILLDDHITMFGSFNFSDNADKDNDENLLIVDDPDFTAQFEQEYQRVLATAKNPPPKTTKQPANQRIEKERSS